jgi:hypothetical protein
MSMVIIGVIFLVLGLRNEIKIKNSKRPVIVLGIGLIFVGVLETIQRHISN